MLFAGRAGLVPSLTKSVVCAPYAPNAMESKFCDQTRISAWVAVAKPLNTATKEMVLSICFILLYYYRV